MSDLRDEYISRVVQGKSFVDVGGLWGCINEKVSVAHKWGASELTMFDMQPEGNDLWVQFHDRMREHDICDYRCIAGELSVADSGVFDVVHCSGVLYHHPHPMILIERLRRMTREHLILTSVISREMIENERGTYRIPPSAVLFVPALSEQERNVLDLYWRSAGVDGVYGITEKAAFRMDEFGPWWWLPTAQALRSMCEAAGLRVLEADHTWNGNAYTLLLALD